jgi:hypothetical protein
VDFEWDTEYSLEKRQEEEGKKDWTGVYLVGLVFSLFLIFFALSL